jgi:putative endonuclease
VTWQSQSMNKQYYVYIMTNETNTVTYTGMTNDLLNRVTQHKNKIVKGFTSKYNINKLVYFETGEDVYGTLTREKQIKSWPRIRKTALVNSTNPEWRDIYPEMVEG